MEISIDRYLDDGADLFMTLGLRSRTTEMHSVLSALDAAQREAVQEALARALDEIAGVLSPAAAAQPRRGVTAGDAGTSGSADRMRTGARSSAG